MAQIKAGAIPRRILGGTGLKVSVIGFGCSPLGSVFREINEEEAIKAVHEAANLGINIFDTSPFYGETRSEQVLGRALKSLPVPREEIIISSKVGRYGEAKFDFSRERVLSSIEESFGRLGVDYLDIVYCHDIEFGDLDQVVNETIPALRELQAQGKIKFIGVSGLPLKALAYVVERTKVDVILSYCHYTLLDSTLVSLLPKLKEKNIGVVNASAMSMGMLTPHGPPVWHPAPQSVKDAVAKALEICESKNVNIAEVSLKWALSTCEDVHMTLVGMCTVEEVTKNVKTCLAAFGVLDESTQDAEKEVLEKMKEIFSPIKDITWPSGKQENN